MGNVVVLEVKDALRVLDDSTGVTGDEELDRLGHAVVGEERPRLGPDELSSGSSDGDEEGGGGGRLGGDFAFGRAAELDVDKVDLELLLGLDSDQDRGTTAGDDHLVGKVDRLEDKGERSLLFKRFAQVESAGASREGRERRTHELHDDALDKSGEGHLFTLLRVPEVLGENSSDLRVGVTPERIATLLKDEAELLVCNGEVVF